MNKGRTAQFFQNFLRALFAPLNELFWFLATHSAAFLCALMLPLLFFRAQLES